YTAVDPSGYVSNKATVVCYLPEVRDDEFDLSTLEPAGGWYDLKVMSNDDYYGLDITSVTQPEHGQVEINDDKNSLLFLPEDGYNGWTFTYTAGISAGTNKVYEPSPAVVKVYSGDVPTVASDDTATTTAGKSVNIDVLANDTGPLISIDSISIAPQHGTAEISNGKITYTPAPDFTGEDTFSYTIQDIAGETAEAAVTVSVSGGGGGSGIAVDDTVYTKMNTTSGIAVLLNDYDQKPPLNIISVTSPSHGTAVIDNDKINYTPDDDWTGKDSFDYTVEDNAGRTDTAAVTVVVNEEGTVDAISKAGIYKACENAVNFLTEAGDITDSNRTVRTFLSSLELLMYRNAFKLLYTQTGKTIFQNISGDIEYDEEGSIISGYGFYYLYKLRKKLESGGDDIGNFNSAKETIIGNLNTARAQYEEYNPEG
ncbi:MAG: cadherin-like domain-containing protein, partial [Victivallales bacterium]|nr:cadherin-like domain-containing protein [Victivallales bacterium]